MSEYPIIYSINRRAYVAYDVIIDEERMSVNDQFRMFQDSLCVLNSRLKTSNLCYNDLKCALLPPDNNKGEFVFIFDEGLQSVTANYIMDSFKFIVPLLKELNKSTMSINSGDLIYDLNYHDLIVNMLKNHLYDASRVIYSDKSCYYAIYFNNLSKKMAKDFDTVFLPMSHYIGYANINELSVFKSIIAHSLPTMFILCKGHAIFPEAEDEIGKTNSFCYFELKDHFKPILVPESVFGFFLSFRIDSLIRDKRTAELSFVVAYPLSKKISDFDFEFNPIKKQYLCKNKPHLSKIFGPDYDIDTIESFVKSLEFNHIYHVKYYSDNGCNEIHFNIRTSYFDSNKRPHCLIVALKIDLNTNKMGLITIY